MKLLVGPGLRDPKGHEAPLVKALRRVAYVRTFEPGPSDFNTVLRALPHGWNPDAVLVRDAEFYKIPRGLECAPMPVFALVGDYNLSLPAMLPILGSFDHFFCDSNGERIFKKLGLTHCGFFCLYGYDPEVHREYAGPKDWDIVFIGNLNHAVQQDRESSLYELARIGKRYRVHISTGIYGQEYARILSSAHLVFNRAIRDEANMRFFEAIGCGATVMNRRLDELDRLGFFADEHYLECGTIQEAVERYFETWTAVERDRLKWEAGQAIRRHSYEQRAVDLVERMRSTPVDLAQRIFRGLDASDRKRRWDLHHAGEVSIPGGGRLTPFDPTLVRWQKLLVDGELEIRGFDFQMWFWWADLLAESGLYRFLADFLLDREALLDAFGCYGSITQELRRRLNRLIYGFSL